MTAPPPGDEPDLLSNGSDRDPWPTRTWRPTRRHAVVAAAAVLGVLATTSAVQVARNVAHDRALHAAARREVRFAVTWGGNTADTTSVTLTSLGHDPVVLESAHVDGYRDTSSLPSLAEGTSTDVLMNLAQGCDGTARPAQLVVTATTARHQRVRRTLSLPKDVRVGLEEARALLCADPPDQSLTWYVAGTRVEGSAVVVTYELGNQALVPLTVLALRSLPGLVVSGLHLPLRLAPREPGTAVSTMTPLSVRVSVRDCRALRGRVGRPFSDEVFATVSARGRTAVRGMTLTDYASFDGPSEQKSTLASLLRTCR